MLAELDSLPSLLGPSDLQEEEASEDQRSEDAQSVSLAVLKTIQDTLE